jgi:hypothetical protein
MPLSEQFYFFERYPTRLQQKPPMPEPDDVGLTAGTCLIPHRHLNHLEVLLDGPKYEVEIAETRTIGCYDFAIAFTNHSQLLHRKLSFTPAIQLLEI